MSHSVPNPVCRCFRMEEGAEDVQTCGPVRILTAAGRSGLHPQSVTSSLSVTPARNTINEPEGSLTFWIFPLEDSGYATEAGLFMQHEPDCLIAPILTDALPLRNLNDANFFITWHPRWWRQLLFRFNRYEKGPKGFYECHGDHIAFGPCDLHLKGAQWVQLGLTWNHETQTYFLYVNGVPVANGHQWVKQAVDACREQLHAGSPLFAYGELQFYDRALDADAMARVFERDQREETAESAAQTAALRQTHAPESLPEVELTPGPAYRTVLDVPFTDPADLDLFYIQGATESVQITPEGLLIETPVVSHPADGNCQVYLHTWEMFEGDVAVEFDFMTLKEEGLGLLMVQSSGMQREDYMKDYPLRTASSMDMVHRENVRNYHWEFWREMDGIRSDRSTGAFIKNPRLRPLAYQAMPGVMSKNEWHRVRFLQEGNRLRGSIDGQLIFDVRDNPYDGSGPVYTCGHVTIRNMFKSKCMWKNLKVSVRPPPYQCFSS